MEFTGLDADAARAFAARWLPAWTGNEPERLAAFYAGDAFYSDPAIPEGVRGRPALLAYFRKLLAGIPTGSGRIATRCPSRDGFLNLWHASIPAGGRTADRLAGPSAR